MTSPKQQVKAVKIQVQKRPAETGGLVAAAVVTTGLWMFGLEPPPQVVGALVVLVGSVPSAISYLKDR